jgi:phosphohistidine phosphatase SixA
MTVVCPPVGTGPPLSTREFGSAQITEMREKKRGRPHWCAAAVHSPALRARGYHCLMEPPGITRHRRPFLAPLYLSVLVAGVLFALGWAFYSQANTTVVFLVCPVEKAPGSIDDPPVSPEGEARAERLAHMFGDELRGGARLDGVYESDDRRAQQTAAPLIERLHRAPVVFRLADSRITAARVVHEHPGGTVLVITSGAAVAEMVQELAGIAAAPAADDADSVYVVSVPSIGRPHVARFRL